MNRGKKNERKLDLLPGPDCAAVSCANADRKEGRTDGRTDGREGPGIWTDRLILLSSQATERAIDRADEKTGERVLSVSANVCSACQKL